MTQFYITTPIYYVNDVPHIGHAYTTVAADVLARFNRMMGRRVFFLTGTDEHGQKVEKAANEAGLTPKAHADKLVVNFKNLWQKLDISNDAFIRTTDEIHKEYVASILNELRSKGLIEKRVYTGWYCTPDERFWTEKEISGGVCPDCGREVERIEEENYFFLMSRYKDRLIRHIEDTPGFILPVTRRNEVLGFLRNNELGDLCISRPKRRLAWGIPLPFDPEFTTYVWFDALLNYCSALVYLTGADRFEWPASHHLVGKDILTTHAVYWSAMLMALDKPLPNNLFAHGWWTVQGKKMSKSLGNVVDPFKVIEDYSADAFRYFLLREVPFGLDGDFSEKALIGRYNSDLANDLGNLVSRAFMMTSKYFDNAVPQHKGIEIDLKNIAESILLNMERGLSELSFNKTLDSIWELVFALNKYIDTKQPWNMAKDEGRRGDLALTIYSILEGLRFISLYLYPFMPKTCTAIYSSLTGGQDISTVNLLNDTTWGRLPVDIKLSVAGQLFPRIDIQTANPLQVHAADNLIDLKDFAKVTLKTARIISAERVKKSDKLIKLQVDAGIKKQIVAGIGKSYDPDTLIGKTIIIVDNLKPAKLMGERSEGMLLAASDPDAPDREAALSLLTVDKEVAPGSSIK